MTNVRVADLVLPLTKGSNPDWYQNHENLAELFRHMRELGQDIEDVQDFLDAPWHYEDLWVLMCASQGDQGARALLEARSC